MVVQYRNKTIIIISLLTVIASLVVMTGWMFGVPVLKQIVPGFVSMVFNTAFCFILFAGALLAREFYRGQYRLVPFFILSAIGTFIGFITLLEFTFHFSAGVDQLFVRDNQTISADHLYAGRMAYNTAICFSLLGLGFLFAGVRNHAFKIAGQYLFHAVSILSSIALIGYLYGVSLFNTLLYVSSMATHTAILFLLLSIAGSLLNPSLGIARLFTGTLVGNQMAKRLFVLIVLMVLVFGSIRVQTQHFKVFTIDIGISLLAVCFLLMSLFIIWNTANWLNRIDIKRTEAEAEVKRMNAELGKRVDERSAEIQRSEARYRSLIEQASDAIYVVDFRGRFREVNDAICRMSGYSREELLQMNVEHIIDPDDLKADPIKHGPRNPADYGIRERRLMRKDGTFFNSEVNVKMFPDDKILVIARDITDRKKIETELKGSEQKYKLLFDSNPSPLLMIDKEQLTIIAVNDEAARLYGYSKEELMHSKITTVRKKGDLASQQERFSRNLAEASNLEVARHVRKDGSEMFVQIAAHDIEFEGRQVRLSMVTDITGRLKAEDTIKKSEANLQSILKATDTIYALFDADLKILAFNERAATFFKHEFHHDVQKGDYIDKVTSAKRLPIIQGYARQVLDGQYVHYEVSYPQADGKVIWYSARLSPISNDKGDVLGMLVDLHDVTESKINVQNLQSAYERIQAHINSIKDMAWKQSHLMRSPLANLKALTAILQDDPADQMTLDHIQNELDRMDAIIIEMAEEASAHDK
jgi:two-component system, sporulation sensor kinase E